LLVVISLIVLLMALLMPALRQAREEARSVRCLGQLRHWGIIHTAYSLDFKNLIPPAVDRENPIFLPDGSYSFYYRPYLLQRGGYYSSPAMPANKIELNWCPSDNEARHTNQATRLGGGPMPDNPWAPYIYQYVMKGSSYGLNPTLKGAWPVNHGIGGPTVRWSEGKYWRIKDIRSALHKTPVLGDSRNFVFGWGGSGSGYMFTPFYGLATRHGGGTFYDGKGNTNMLFADGHGETWSGTRINPHWGQWTYSGWDALPREYAGITWYFGGYQNSSFTN